MIFLLLCAFSCGLRLLVIQLTTTVFLIPHLGSIIYHDTIGFTTMPVTTRSWAKLLTGPTTELSAVLPTGSTELLDLIFRPMSQQNTTCLHLPLYHRCHQRLLWSYCPLTIIVYYLLMMVMFLFQMMVHFKFQNFNRQKFQNTLLIILLVLRLIILNIRNSFDGGWL